MRKKQEKKFPPVVADWLAPREAHSEGRASGGGKPVPRPSPSSHQERRGGSSPWRVRETRPSRRKQAPGCMSHAIRCTRTHVEEGDGMVRGGGEREKKMQWMSHRRKKQHSSDFRWGILISDCILSRHCWFALGALMKEGLFNWPARCCMDCGPTPGNHVGAHEHSGVLLVEHHAPYQVRFSSLLQPTIEL